MIILIGKEEAHKDNKVNSLIDLDKDVCSVKSLAVKKSQRLT